MTALLRSAGILKWVQETCYYSYFSERPTNADVKNSQSIKWYVVVNTTSLFLYLLCTKKEYLINCNSFINLGTQYSDTYLNHNSSINWGGVLLV